MPAKYSNGTRQITALAKKKKKIGEEKCSTNKVLELTTQSEISVLEIVLEIRSRWRLWWVAAVKQRLRWRIFEKWGMLLHWLYLLQSVTSQCRRARCSRYVYICNSGSLVRMPVQCAIVEDILIRRAVAVFLLFVLLLLLLLLPLPLLFLFKFIWHIIVTVVTCRYHSFPLALGCCSSVNRRQREKAMFTKRRGNKQTNYRLYQMGGTGIRKEKQHETKK